MIDTSAIEAALGNGSGVVMLRAGGDDTFAAASGYANRAWNVPVAIDTRFDTASVTKLFTAVATLQCVERGDFALDTPALEFIGLTDSNLSPAITPYHLLTHTSGIADDADEEAGERYEDLFVNTPNYAFRVTADALANFVDKPPDFAPGEGCRYCNAGYILLGLMIERASGLSYREYVAEHVFAPAAMQHSGFFAMDRVEPNVAEGVEAIRDGDGTIAGWLRNIYSYPPIGSPDGGAHVTAGDLLAFHHAVTSGVLLGPDLTAELLAPKEFYAPKMHRSHGGRDNEHFTGFGFQFEVDANGAVRSYWKEGVNVGVSALLRSYPASDITAVVLAVGEDAAWDVSNAIDAAIG